MEGTTLDGRFEIERQVGEGAMGIVYRARDRVSGQAVAVKVMQPRAGADERRFEREARILSQLSHPGVVRYVAHRTSHERTYLAMEWLEGETLEDRLERGTLLVDECVALGMGVAEALIEAHRKGVVHRDLKPANLFLVGGKADQAKVLDFGIARWRWDARALTSMGGTIGTLLYMSPEQACGRDDIDGRSDFFSLAAVLYECLTHRPVFFGRDALAVLAKILREPAEPVRAQRPEVPIDLEALLADMLAKEPDARPQTAQDVRDRLVAVGAGLSESARSRGPAPLETAVPRSERYSSSASRSELRVVSVVLVKVDRPVGDAFSLASTELLVDKAHDGDPREALADPSGVIPLADLQAAVASHEARVNPLINGSLVVTLSATATPKEQAVRAARCALSLKRILGDVPMAICTGQAMVRGRAAIGEVIERCSRMLAESAGTGVRIDASTAILIEGRFVVEGGAQNSKVIDELEAPSGHRMLLGKATPYVGRERDLNILTGSFRACVDESEVRAVLVTGPAGQGKTRLLEEVLRRVRDAPAPPVILHAAADSLRSGSAFGTIAPALRALAGVVRDAPLEQRREQMRAYFGRRLGREAAPRVCAFLGELVGIPFEDGALEALAAARQQPRLMADQMLVAWLDWLEAECAVGPVLLVLEDLHWADVPSVQFVGAALRTVRHKPLMVLGLARPEVNDRFPELFGGHDLLGLSLGGLPRKASERIVHETLRDRITAAQCALLVERADGNPFFLEELIRAIDAGADAGALPVTVLGMVHARLDALGDEAKHVLRAASVFGAEFRADGLCAVLGASEVDEDVGECLGVLAQREVIFAKPRSGTKKTFGFRHALVRDAAYAMLAPDDRALCHRLAGHWLESVGETQAVVVAEHFERGSVPGRAAVWFRKAAGQAMEGNDVASTIAHAERAIACGAEGELLGELDWVLMEARQWQGQSAEAMSSGLEALGLLPRASASWFRASGQLVCVAATFGDTARAEGVARDVLAAESVRPCDASGLLGLANGAYGMTVGCTFARTGREVADELADAFERSYRRLAPQPLAEAWLEAVRGMKGLLDNDWARAIRFMEAAADAFRRLGDMRGLSMALGNVGWFRQELGSLPRAVADLSESAEIAERLGLRNFEAHATRALVLFSLDKLADAESLCRSCLREAEKRGEGSRAGFVRSYLARILAAQGKHEDAEREGRAAITELDEQSPYRPAAVAAVAGALLGQNRTADALGTARSAAETLGSTGGAAPECDAYVQMILAEALHANGLTDDAKRVIRAAKDKVDARAAAITDDELRQSFLAHVPDNARTLALAREWGA